jgi:hypothetical protein
MRGVCGAFMLTMGVAAATVARPQHGDIPRVQRHGQFASGESAVELDVERLRTTYSSLSRSSVSDVPFVWRRHLAPQNTTPVWI